LEIKVKHFGFVAGFKLAMGWCDSLTAWIKEIKAFS